VLGPPNEGDPRASTLNRAAPPIVEPDDVTQRYCPDVQLWRLTRCLATQPARLDPQATLRVDQLRLPSDEAPPSSVVRFGGRYWGVSPAAKVVRAYRLSREGTELVADGHPVPFLRGLRASSGDRWLSTGGAVFDSAPRFDGTGQWSLTLGVPRPERAAIEAVAQSSVGAASPLHLFGDDTLVSQDARGRLQVSRVREGAFVPVDIDDDEHTYPGLMLHGAVGPRTCLASSGSTLLFIHALREGPVRVARVELEGDIEAVALRPCGDVFAEILPRGVEAARRIVHVRRHGDERAVAGAIDLVGQPNPTTHLAVSPGGILVRLVDTRTAARLEAYAFDDTGRCTPLPGADVPPGALGTVHKPIFLPCGTLLTYTRRSPWSRELRTFDVDGSGVRPRGEPKTLD
jgi:hypothetical protein